MLKLPSSWQTDWQFEDFFKVLESLEGEVFREKDGRRTFRYSLEGKSCFIKMHRGVGWRNIFKALFRLRLPVLSAKNEWMAIERLTGLGVDTMKLVGYGIRGCNPARLRSFVITEDLSHTISLEDYCRQWKNVPPPPRLKRALIKKVAGISRVLHENGINHRDYYICHFLLDVSTAVDTFEKPPPLYLIDLHRVQVRKRLPRRWRVKDIAGLYFSSMGLGLTQRDLLRFIREYRPKSLRRSLEEDRLFWKSVRKKGMAGHREFVRKYPHAAEDVPREEIERAAQ